MFTSVRQHKILEILQSNPSVRVSYLSELFGVSEVTIRRDLDQMHEARQIQRIRGGAIRVERAAPEPPADYRTMEKADEKRRIGKAAAAMIHDGEIVFIGSGTTALEVAKNLTGRKKLTVITNAMNVINTLAFEESITLIHTGGLLRLSEFSFIGYITEQSLRDLHPQKVILGIHAFSLKDGLMNDYLPEVTTDRAILQAAPEVILVADHSKFGKISVAFVAPVSAVHKVVTDSGIRPEIVAELKRMNIEVIVA
jgi:DeoR/GlpR family transcriptional regulator of sugar metabolism